MWAVIDSIVCQINSWVLVKKEFNNCSINDVIRDWVSCISDFNGVNNDPLLDWIPPIFGKRKVNFDVASVRNPRPVAYGYVMQDSQGHVIRFKGAFRG